MFHIVLHGLARDLAEKRARLLFGIGSEVGISGKKTVENGTHFVGIESLEDRAPF